LNELEKTWNSLATSDTDHKKHILDQVTMVVLIFPKFLHNDSYYTFGFGSFLVSFLAYIFCSGQYLFWYKRSKCLH